MSGQEYWGGGASSETELAASVRLFAVNETNLLTYVRTSTMCKCENNWAFRVKGILGRSFVKRYAFYLYLFYKYNSSVF